LRKGRERKKKKRQEEKEQDAFHAPQSYTVALYEKEKHLEKDRGGKKKRGISDIGGSDNICVTVFYPGLAGARESRRERKKREERLGEKEGD